MIRAGRSWVIVLSLDGQSAFDDKQQEKSINDHFDLFLTYFEKEWNFDLELSFNLTM